MNQHCQLIVFSNKAYNAIIDETFKRDPNETGGILLGHVLDNGTWIVMEVLPPGIYSTHEYAYFEYDEAFVNYLANSVASKYEQQLSLLGLWHRHPGSMDFFSGVDDGTNAKFAAISPCGAISGLVNVDPKFRLTMRHVSFPLQYDIVDFEVGDDIIPESYFELRHFPKTGLHPQMSTIMSEAEKKNSETNTVPTSEHPSNSEQENDDCVNKVKKTKSLKSKLLYWMEKALMFIGAISLFYLIFFRSCSNQSPQQEYTSSIVNNDSLKTNITLADTMISDSLDKNSLMMDSLEREYLLKDSLLKDSLKTSYEIKKAKLRKKHNG